MYPRKNVDESTHMHAQAERLCERINILNITIFVRHEHYLQWNAIACL